MREIKFRGKDIETGEWVYGDLYSTSEVPMIVVDGIASEFDNFIVVDPKTIGQYSGLKDKNGVEIYEGDILLYSNSSKSIAYYKNGAFTRSYENSNIYLLYDSFIEDDCLVDYVVIGNIYENPELISR